MIYAPKFPLRFKEKKGFENVDNIKELVRFHLTNLLLTNPGEKISDSSYGVGLRQMLFENMTIGTLNVWKDKIEGSINRHLGYVNLNEVEIRPFFEQNKINIKISYSVLNDTEEQILELSLTTGDSGVSSAAY